MVPASLRLKKATIQPKAKRVMPMPNAAPRIGPDGVEENDDIYLIPNVAPTAAPQIGAPRSRPKGVFDSKYEDFMSEMAGLGALES